VNIYDFYRPCYGINSTIWENSDAESHVNYAKWKTMPIIDDFGRNVGGSRIDAWGAAPCVDSVGAFNWFNNPNVSAELNIFTNLTV